MTNKEIDDRIRKEIQILELARKEFIQEGKTSILDEYIETLKATLSTD